MRALRLGRTPHGEVVVDLCPACRGLWFDAHESPQLTPAATLDLLRAAGGPPEPVRAGDGPKACPRCRKPLAATQDLQRATRFAYWRCAAGHGRFTPLVQFMREKNYVRPLSRAEVDLVRSQIGTLRCSGCGAPVDLGADAACRYCGAAVVALDPEAIRRILAASRPPTAPEPPPATIDALLAAQARRRGASPARGADLVLDGIAALLEAFGRP